MPKNAVQRLQKLHNELKSVISIYDAASATNLPSERGLEKSEPKRKNHCKSGNGIPKLTVSQQTEPNDVVENYKFGSLKGKPVSLFSRDFPSQESPPWVMEASTMTKKSIWSSKIKPSSAPSRASSSTGNYESESFFEPSQSSHSQYKSESEKSTATDELMLSPSKCIQKANELLKKHQYRNEDTSDCDQSVGFGGNTDYSEDPETETGFGVPLHTEGRTIDSLRSPIGLETRKPNRTRSESPRKERVHELPKQESVKRPVTGKNWAESQKEKISVKTTNQLRNETQKKIQRLEKNKTSEVTCKTNPLKCRTKSREHDKAGEISDPENAKKGEKAMEQRLTEERKCLNPRIGSSKGIAKLNPTGKSNQQAKNSLSGTNINNRKEKVDKAEFQAQELSRIIEKSNEKMEKMKVSKNLAIDIAKQLKNKYEEIKTSKNILIDRLQKVEKVNERLNIEVKMEKDSRMQLQEDFEKLKSNSNTMLLENTMKTKEIYEENVNLKARIKEIEKEQREKAKDIGFDIKRRSPERNHNSSHLTESSPILRKLKDASSPEFQTTSETDSPKMTNEKRRLAKQITAESDDSVKKLSDENSQLIQKVKELGILLRERQFRIDSLENKMKEIEDEFRRQKHHLQQKSERLEDTNKELESIRQNSMGLEEQVKLLRQSIENFDQMHQNMLGKSSAYENQIKLLKDQITQLKTEKEKLKKDLENERDSLLIKNKIIDDQQETIKQMREKSDEMKNLVKKNQSLERLLNIEREQKMELQEAVERLKWRKEELKKRVKTLEGDLLLAPQEVVRDLQKTQKVLHELENQVQVKQREWKQHMQSLIKEKEQACSVAEFATKKLMQTTSEFQKQSEAHKRLHKVLVENLAEKERHLREVNEKMSQSQLKELLSEAEEETNRLVRLTEFASEKGMVSDMNIWTQRNRLSPTPVIHYDENDGKRKFPMDF